MIANAKIKASNQKMKDKKHSTDGKNSKTNLKVEERLAELEKILEHLESSDDDSPLELEEAFKSFERAMTLSADLKKMLAGYERRVTVLMEENKNSNSLENFKE